MRKFICAVVMTGAASGGVMQAGEADWHNTVEVSVVHSLSLAPA